MTVKSLIPSESVINKILVIRNQKVILDRDLAVLYNVETRALKQAVRRNIRRFPEDFMFQLTKEEFNIWRSQTVMSKSDQKGLRYPPYAFTEQGVAMLSSVLKSERAIEIIQIFIIHGFSKMEYRITNPPDRRAGTEYRISKCLVFYNSFYIFHRIIIHKSQIINLKYSYGKTWH